jgi:hypothetical protein
MKHIHTFESFINENKSEDYEFDQWYREMEGQHDHRLKKFAKLMSIKLPNSTGDYHELETTNIQMSPNDLLKYGLVPVDYATDKPGNISLAWDSSKGLVIVNGGSSYTSKKVADKYKNQSTTYEEVSEASEAVYEIWLEIVKNK